MWHIIYVSVIFTTPWYANSLKSIASFWQYSWKSVKWEESFTISVPPTLNLDETKEWIFHGALCSNRKAFPFKELDLFLGMKSSKLTDNWFSRNINESESIDCVTVLRDVLKSKLYYQIILPFIGPIFVYFSHFCPIWKQVWKRIIDFSKILLTYIT